ncbi:hypothetical protein [Benzoatithermus flavus]|uniref:Uncharacterized protein n=1 Tax=Benzoatithermus flavus TaxID=3108223 RepID=A0ABU8XMB1_9PROT
MASVRIAIPEAGRAAVAAALAFAADWMEDEEIIFAETTVA